MPVITRATPKSPRLDLYAQSAVLPTESPDEFAAHFQALRQELKPVGLLEESQVAVIAQLLWRKPGSRFFMMPRKLENSCKRQFCDAKTKQGAW